MTKPIIHLNGSGKDNLLRQYTEALDAIATAQEKLQECLPHPRDYYVSPQAGAYENARIEHLARLQMVETVRREIEDLAAHVINPTLEIQR